MCDIPDAPPTSWGGLRLTRMRISSRGASCEARARDHLCTWGSRGRLYRLCTTLNLLLLFFFLKKT